ncbi:MAG TPA: cysteine synthase family protein [Sphingobacterium sp.]|nr:cysteine synthase family protein [Sphingobacterium sp.]
MNFNCLSSFCIGNTPLRKDLFLSGLLGCSVLVKEEFNSSLGMSSKDRIAFYMVKDAVKNKGLKEGDTIVEASSGNTGIGLASLAKLLELKCRIYVNKSCSEEKVGVLLNLDASVEKCENSNGLTDPVSTQSCALRYAKKNKNAVFLNQYNNVANFKAHFETTGPEIWKQTEGRITHFIAGVGTGGTISGTAKYLKEQNPDIQIYGVEPLGSVLNEYLKNRIMPSSSGTFEKIDGIGRNFIPGNFHPEFIDYIFQVSKENTFQRLLDYKEKTGFLCGVSSGAVLQASIENLSDSLKPTDVVVLLFPDHGSRYFRKLNTYERQLINHRIKRAI